MGHGPLGDEVVDVVGPVLDGRVADAGALLGDHFNHGGVQAVGAVHRRRAAFDVMDLSAFVDDDQRALELAHVGRVDAEVRLQGELHVHARRHVDKRPARPHRGVQRGELVVAGGNDRAEVLFHQIRVLADGGVGVGKDHAPPRHLFAQRAVHDFALVLRLHAGEKLLLRLGNAKLVEGALDLGGHVVPRFYRMVGRLEVIVDVLEHHLDIAAPARHGLRLEGFQALQTELAASMPARVSFPRSLRRCSGPSPCGP